jgi:hypothetical protein
MGHAARKDGMINYYNKPAWNREKEFLGIWAHR